MTVVDRALTNDNALIADCLLRLTTTHKRWGFGLCFLYLRNVQKLKFNHKPVFRIYRERELNLRIKPRRRIRRDKPDPLEVPREKNQVWSIDVSARSTTVIDASRYRC